MHQNCFGCQHAFVQNGCGILGAFRHFLLALTSTAQRNPIKPKKNHHRTRNRYILEVRNHHRTIPTRQFFRGPKLVTLVGLRLRKKKPLPMGGMDKSDLSKDWGEPKDIETFKPFNPCMKIKKNNGSTSCPCLASQKTSSNQPKKTWEKLQVLPSPSHITFTQTMKTIGEDGETWRAEIAGTWDPGN